jgi:class 3 adenylate cyclase
MEFLNRLSIQSKLMVMLLAVSLATILVTAYVGYSTGREALVQTLFNQMTVLRTSRAREVQAYLAGVRNNAITLSASPIAIAAMRSFREAFAQLEKEADLPQTANAQLSRFYRQQFIPQLQPNVEGVPSADTYIPKTQVGQYLQYYYLAANPNPMGHKDRLDNPQDGSLYSRVHQRFHPFLKDIAQRFHYSGFYLIDSSTGDVVYSVNKSPLFATNLESGLYANSNLASLFVTLRDNSAPNAFNIVDFAPFRPYYGKPAAFIGSPIFDGPNLIGILALQLPVEEINRIMTGNQSWMQDGLGKTGETYLVGPDYLMRSQSRFLLENPSGYLKELAAQGISPKTIERIRTSRSSILLQDTQSPAVEKALAGEAGTAILKDYRDVTSLVSYAPLKLDDLRWAIVAKIYAGEAFVPIYTFGKRVLVTAAILVPAVTLLSIFLSRLLVRPIYRIIAGTRKVAAGETDVQVEVPSKDEFRQLADSFNEMTRNLHAQQQALEAQIQENDALLLHILPPTVAKRLKSGEQLIADSFANVTVLYAELAGFCELSGMLPADRVVELLNDIVSAFDEAAERHGVEKIKTIGTAYLATSGLCVSRLDHAKYALDFALEMVRIVRLYAQEQNVCLNVCIGIDSGSVVAGLIGKTKFFYDLWGNTVNLARSLAAEGKPNTILVSASVCHLLQDLYEFSSLGEIPIRDRGMLEVWTVKG